MKIRTRITPDGIIQERIFSTPTEPGPPASVSIEIPAYTQAGDEIGTGGGGGGGGITEEEVALLEAYAGAADLSNSVGKVTVTLLEFGEGLANYIGSYIAIHDVGNGNAQQTIEFVENPGDPATIPGAYTISVSGKTLSNLRNDLITAINTGDSIFAPKAWSLTASLPSTPLPFTTQFVISYTGLGGASGGAAVIDDSMDVLFEDVFTFPYQFITFSKYSLQDTTLDGRLSQVDPGDGCIVVPLTTTGGSTWSARYPIHPNGITITGMSLYTPSTWSSGGKVLLDVKKTDSSGERLIFDAARLFYVSSYPGWNSSDHGWPLYGPLILDSLTFANRSYPLLLDVTSENLTLDEVPKPSIYVSITAPGGTSAPAAGTAKLYIHYRVNS